MRQIMKLKLKALLMAGTASVCLAAPAFAQEGETDDVDTVVITGSPLGGTAAESTPAVTTVSREEIEESGAATLGDLLANQPGIAESSFAGGASRPIIRGLDNFRVRIQENGIGSHDASALSEDHGVAIDPLAAERIEVVRGPAVLRYGSEAIGGVVNVINNRIPAAAPEGGFEAEGFAMYSTVDEGWQAGGLADFGGEGFAGHLDAFFRDADDYETPQGTQDNTYVTQSGGSAGGSLLFPTGHIGASVSYFQSEYGIPAGEEDIFIDMNQTKVQIGGDFDDPFPGFSRVQFSGGFSDYTHDEVATDTGDIGSTFNNEEYEGRVELTHNPVGAFTGAVGFQGRTRDLAASGEGGELVAPSETRSIGGFLFEEADLSGTATLQFAARVEHVEIEGTGFLPIGPMGMEFPASRDFTPVSGSAGLIFDLGSEIYLSGTAQVVQRAPDVLELFSKGPHEATETFEIGNPNLDMETARSIELTLERIDGPVRWEVAAYYTSFQDFIFKNYTGVDCGEGFDTCGVEDELRQVAYGQQDATFRGFEGSIEWDVVEMANGGVITLDAMSDYVRAEFDDGGNVPRIPPFRVGGGITFEDNHLTVGGRVTFVSDQDDLGVLETSTNGYTDVGARIAYRFDLPNTETQFEVGLAASNLLDEDMRNHTSFKKDDVLLPGRNVRLFVRATF